MSSRPKRKSSKSLEDIELSHFVGNFDDVLKSVVKATSKSEMEGGRQHEAHW
jgi:hypothetical protein